MGNFFNSPKEDTAGTLADLAMGGRLPQGWENKINSSAKLAKTGVESNAARTMATNTADLLSQSASMGLGTGTTSAIGKNNAQIAERTSESLSNIDIAALQQTLNSLGQVLNLGVGNMKNTTGFGDLLAGLSTVTNVAGGVVGMGGSQGLGWWGAQKPNAKVTPGVTATGGVALPVKKKSDFDFTKTKAEPTMLDWVNNGSPR
jgi:hypothetical protein